MEGQWLSNAVHVLFGYLLNDFTSPSPLKTDATCPNGEPFVRSPQPTSLKLLKNIVAFYVYKEINTTGI